MPVYRESPGLGRRWLVAAESPPELQEERPERAEYAEPEGPRYRAIKAAVSNCGEERWHHEKAELLVLSGGKFFC